jgi:hypothetical protein
MYTLFINVRKFRIFYTAFAANPTIMDMSFL